MKKIYIANWKMNLSPAQEFALAKDFVKVNNDNEVVVCPTFLGLPAVAQILKNTSIKYGSQDVSNEEPGSFTGQIAAKYLKQIGCAYAIIGHSERRQYLNESDLMINKKITAALKNKIIPILCIGETLTERKNNQVKFVLQKQLQSALSKIQFNKSDKMIIAYEPVWAIGKGKAAKASDLASILQLIKEILAGLTIKSSNVGLIYGGSISAKNCSEFANLPLLDGFLIGGASLKTKEFFSIIKNT